MNKETLLKLDEMLDKTLEMMPLFDESPLGRILDEMHENFHQEFSDAIASAIAIEEKYKNRNKKPKKIINSNQLPL